MKGMAAAGPLPVGACKKEGGEDSTQHEEAQSTARSFQAPNESIQATREVRKELVETLEKAAAEVRQRRLPMQRARRALAIPVAAAHMLAHQIRASFLVQLLVSIFGALRNRLPLRNPEAEDAAPPTTPRLEQMSQPDKTCLSQRLPHSQRTEEDCRCANGAALAGLRNWIDAEEHRSSNRSALANLRDFVEAYPSQLDFKHHEQTMERNSRCANDAAAAGGTQISDFKSPLANSNEVERVRAAVAAEVERVRGVTAALAVAAAVAAEAAALAAKNLAAAAVTAQSNLATAAAIQVAAEAVRYVCIHAPSHIIVHIPLHIWRGQTPLPPTIRPPRHTHTLALTNTCTRTHSRTRIHKPMHTCINRVRDVTTAAVLASRTATAATATATAAVTEVRLAEKSSMREREI